MLETEHIAEDLANAVAPVDMQVCVYQLEQAHVQLLLIGYDSLLLPRTLCGTPV